MKWKLALAQHPMYMLIREDTQCAERTPPWGAPTIEAYIERVSQNLDALENYPRLKLGYEWSAVELELLANDLPVVFQKLRRYAAEGRVCFYNGTYAQPHLQTLSAGIQPAPVRIWTQSLPGTRPQPGACVRAPRGERT